MKAYILSENDLSNLLAYIDRDPRYGDNGGSSRVLTKEEQEAFTESYRFFNYQVRRWIDEVKR
jgi:hypothetical protein